MSASQVCGKTKLVNFCHAHITWLTVNKRQILLEIPGLNTKTIFFFFAWATLRAGDRGTQFLPKASDQPPAPLATLPFDPRVCHLLDALDSGTMLFLGSH